MKPLGAGLGLARSLGHSVLGASAHVVSSPPLFSPLRCLEVPVSLQGQLSMTLTVGSHCNHTRSGGDVYPPVMFLEGLLSTITLRTQR